MKTGVVTGRVWATKRISGLPAGALLEIDLEDRASRRVPERLVAFDPLGCGEGERVLIVQGSVAKGWFAEANVAIDALVIGSLDETGKPPSGPPRVKSKRN